MLCPSELLKAYESCFQAKLLNELAVEPPVRSSTRQIFRLLATALCCNCESATEALVRRPIAESLHFSGKKSTVTDTASLTQSSMLQQQRQQQSSSEMATITALDIPQTMRFFQPASSVTAASGSSGDVGSNWERSESRGASSSCWHHQAATGDLQSDCPGISGCEQMLASRLRDVYFPKRSAQLLTDLQLAECLTGWIGDTVDKLFDRFFSSGSSEEERTAKTHVDMALNTDGSNSYRPARHHQNQHQLQDKHPRRHRQQEHIRSQNHHHHSQQQKQQQQQHERIRSQNHHHSQQQKQQEQEQEQKPQQQQQQQQRLCKLHAGGGDKLPAGESSCAVCAARHFLQQHLGRIARQPDNLAKLERTLRDCLQLQAHWRKSLQWIAANVKESRLPDFVRPLVNNCCAEETCAQTLTVNPQIIIKTAEGCIKNKSTWDKKAAPATTG